MSIDPEQFVRMIDATLAIKPTDADLRKMWEAEGYKVIEKHPEIDRLHPTKEQVSQLADESRSALFWRGVQYGAARQRLSDDLKELKQMRQEGA